MWNQSLWIYRSPVSSRFHCHLLTSSQQFVFSQILSLSDRILSVPQDQHFTDDGIWATGSNQDALPQTLSYLDVLSHVQPLLMLGNGFLLHTQHHDQAINSVLLSCKSQSVNTETVARRYAQELGHKQECDLCYTRTQTYSCI